MYCHILRYLKISYITIPKNNEKDHAIEEQVANHLLNLYENYVTQGDYENVHNILQITSEITKISISTIVILTAIDRNTIHF